MTGGLGGGEGLAQGFKSGSEGLPLESDGADC
jgi:hypothetical protein